MLDQTFLPSRPTVSYRRQILIVLGAGIAVFLLRDPAPAAHRAMVGLGTNYALLYGSFEVAFVATAALILFPAYGRRKQTTRAVIAWFGWFALLGGLAQISTHYVFHGHHAKFLPTFSTVATPMAWMFGLMWLTRKVLTAVGSWLFSGSGNYVAYPATFIGATTDSNAGWTPDSRPPNPPQQNSPRYEKRDDSRNPDVYASDAYFEKECARQDAQLASNRAYDARVREQQAADNLRRAEQDRRNAEQRSRW